MKKLILLILFLLVPTSAWAGYLLQGNGDYVLQGNGDRIIINHDPLVITSGTHSNLLLNRFVQISGGSMLNCTIYDGKIQATGDCTITNTIGGLSNGDDIDIASGVTVTGTYNCFRDAGKAGGGSYSDTGSTTLWSADPLFNDAAGGVYSLQAASPCRDEGYDLSGIVDDDYDGNPRPVGSGYDMGAFEFQTAAYNLGAGGAFVTFTAFYAVHGDAQAGDRFELLGDVLSLGTLSGNGAADNRIVLDCNGYDISGWGLSGNYWTLEKCR